MFRGDFPLTLDAKGRVAVPARQRERIAEQCAGSLVITVNVLHPCLSLYPMPQWQQVEEALAQLPALDEQADNLRHLLLGQAAEVEMDGHGRILVPPGMREWAELDKRVRLVGQGRRLELWSEDVWTAHLGRLRERAKEVVGAASPSVQGVVL